MTDSEFILPASPRNASKSKSKSKSETKGEIDFNREIMVGQTRT